MINKKSPSNVKYNLSNNKRYLDDLLAINCAEFIEISKKYLSTKVNSGA
jgi:hypothetical protein